MLTVAQNGQLRHVVDALQTRFRISREVARAVAKVVAIGISLDLIVRSVVELVTLAVALLHGLVFCLVCALFVSVTMLDRVEERTDLQQLLTQSAQRGTNRQQRAYCLSKYEPNGQTKCC